ncbi:3-dehydroquinate synthase [Dissostichus eleginoides]|uniref:3-dehydroquinate synthase n=1 Tax=Dissostichus eleginoides TaxID=100907 RepID=A0AAD9BU90_DISEL|nr:3-dehydroquinate synthase [Dissostichus eleginoides]
MSEFRRIMMSSFLMLLLHFTAADMKEYFHMVRAGDEVTLPFENVIDDQDKCENTTWTFRDSRSSVTLFEDGQIHKEAKAKPDRLRTAQIRTTTRSIPLVLLSVVTMTGHQDNDEVTLRCSVKTDGCCSLSVKWLLQGQDVDTDHRDIKTSHPQSSGQDCKHPEGPALWWVLMVSVGLAALIISVVTVHIWTRTKGGKKRIRKNLEQNDEDEDEVNYENDGGPSASV